MSQLSAVYFVIILIILLFGIISLPHRSAKRLRFPDGPEIAKDAMASATMDVAKAGIQQAALGKESTESKTYASDQKLMPSPEMAKVK
jgi:hypothetical protein